MGDGLTCEYFDEARLNGMLVKGYKISSSKTLCPEYMVLERNDRDFETIYYLVHHLENINKRKFTMGTYIEEDAVRKLKQITQKRLEELSEELGLPILKGLSK